MRRGWRRGVLRLYQLACWLRAGHRWSERELELHLALPGYRNPSVWTCGRCGRPVIREEDE